MDNNKLDERQQEQLLKFMQTANYNSSGVILGPNSSRFYKPLYKILDILGPGYYSEITNSAKVNDDKSDIYVYVLFDQATKLLRAITEITGQSISTITNDAFVPKVKTVTPFAGSDFLRNKKTKPRGRIDKKDLVGIEVEISSMNIDVSFKDLL